jgi:hypothetical protein
MAKATATTKIVTEIVTESVTLVLSIEEANAILAVCQHIGGSPTESRRGLFNDNPNSIAKVLELAGCDPERSDIPQSSNIYFNNRSK